jgi:hypothetical protein
MREGEQGVEVAFWGSWRGCVLVSCVCFAYAYHRRKSKSSTGKTILGGKSKLCLPGTFSSCGGFLILCVCGASLLHHVVFFMWRQAKTAHIRTYSHNQPQAIPHTTHSNTPTPPTRSTAKAQAKAKATKPSFNNVVKHSPRKEGRKNVDRRKKKSRPSTQ